MLFLNPFLLFGLPLIALPLIIHLINRQRHRTIPWGAMMFLLDAKRLQKNMAKLRYWLIMAMRMLAIAGLVFAASRPLSTGWLGSAVGSKADTVILILDRSPSMEQTDPLTNRTKRESALGKIADLLEKTGEGKRVVLIENSNYAAEEIDATMLEQLPAVTPLAAEADIPRMLQVAEEYLVTNEVGQADIWIASDLRTNDWRKEDGRWSAIRDGFSELDGVRFHLLTYGDQDEENLSISVRNVRKRQIGRTNELVLDVTVRRQGEDETPRTLPVEFVVNGARSVLEIELLKHEFTLQGHVIPIDAAVESGWGRVEIPGDANPADNMFYFVFADESPRHVTIVSDDKEASSPMRIAAAASPDPALAFTAESLTSARVGEIDWEKTTLLIWHAQLPSGTLAQQLTGFLNQRKPVLFFPPAEPGGNQMLGLEWGAWQEVNEAQPLGVGSWDNETGLLAKSQSGNALPLGKQRTFQYCQLKGVGRSLARLTNGDALLLRADDDAPAYFYTTLPRSNASTLAKDGVALYVMLQRAIETGAMQQGNARQLEAGLVEGTVTTDWKLLTTLPEHVVSSDRPFHAGGYQSGDEQWVAVNRPASEDGGKVLSDASLDELFVGLDYHQISDDAGTSSPLANEIWRVFLALMALALIFEAALCLG